MTVFDFETYVTTWAARQYNRVKSSNRGFNGSMVMDVDWSRVSHSTENTQFSQNTQLLQTPISRRVYQSLPSQPSGQVVFISNYENKTDEVQDHTFMIERQTEALVRTKLITGFSTNGKVNVSVPVPPEISNMTSGFGSEIPILSEDEKTVTHTIKWGMNTTVRALPRKRTVAKLTISETERIVTFSAYEIIRGRVLVKISYGDTTQIIEGDLGQIITDGITDGTINNEDGAISVNGRKVTWLIKGELKFKFGISQNVEVWTENI